MSFRVLLTENAERDLHEIDDYITSTDSPEAAERELAPRIGEICHHIGFALLTNHGVSSVRFSVGPSPTQWRDRAGFSPASEMCRS